MSPSRNDPCPCGSGRKYKHCCGAPGSIDALGRANAPPARRGQVHTEADVRAAAAATSTWAADVVPLLTTMAEVPDGRPVGVLVTAGELVVHADVRTGVRGEPLHVAVALEQAVIAAAMATGVYPERVLVRHDDVAAILAPQLAAREIAVEVREDAGLVDAARAMIHRVAGSDAWPPLGRVQSWRAWGIAPATIAELFDAAADYYERAPWRHAAHLQAPRAVLPSGREWTCMLLGSAHEHFGLALYSRADDLFAPDEFERPFDWIRGRLITLSFGPASDAGAAAAHELRKHRWRLAGPAAYPDLITVNTPAGGISDDDVTDIIALLRSVPAFVSKHARALQREQRTGKPIDIEWTEPVSGIAFRYAGDGAGTDDDASYGEDLAVRTDMFRDELSAAVRQAVAELGEDAGEDALFAHVNRSMQRVMEEANARPQADFGGLSPAQLHRLLNRDWSAEGALQLNPKLELGDVAHTTIFAHARTLLGLARERDGLGATQRGFLKLDVMATLFERLTLDALDREFLSERQRVQETDLPTLHQVRIVCELTRLLQRRKQYFRLTRNGERLLDDQRAGALYALLFRTWFRTFNLDYGTATEWPALQEQLAYTLYRLADAAADWQDAASLLPEIVLPYAREQLPPKDHPFADILLRTRVLDVLVDFGLLERAGSSILTRDLRYRVSPLTARFLSFQL